MIYLHYKDTKTFGHSFSFLLIFKTLRASYLQVGNFSHSLESNSLKAMLLRSTTLTAGGTSCGKGEE